VDFTLPDGIWGQRWSEMLKTSEKGDQLSEEALGYELESGTVVRIEAWSLVLLRRLA
jgi:hypothetical protein